MQPEDRDIEQWMRQLAGDGSVGSSPETDALRAAIRARNAAICVSHAADDLARERLMKRLEQEGLLSDKKRISRPWISAVAAVLIAIVGSSFLFLPANRDSGVKYRGISGSINVTSVEPERSARDVLQQLRALGLEPRRLERNDRIIVEVEVANENLAAFRAWAAGKGPALAPGVYRVFIDPKQRRE